MGREVITELSYKHNDLLIKFNCLTYTRMV